MTTVTADGVWRPMRDLNQRWIASRSTMEGSRAHLWRDGEYRRGHFMGLYFDTLTQCEARCVELAGSEPVEVAEPDEDAEALLEGVAGAMELSFGTVSADYTAMVEADEEAEDLQPAYDPAAAPYVEPVMDAPLVLGFGRHSAGRAFDVAKDDGTVEHVVLPDQEPPTPDHFHVPLNTSRDPLPARRETPCYGCGVDIWPRMDTHCDACVDRIKAEDDRKQEPGIVRLVDPLTSQEGELSGLALKRAQAMDAYDQVYLDLYGRRSGVRWDGKGFLIGKVMFTLGGLTAAAEAMRSKLKEAATAAPPFPWPPAQERPPSAHAVEQDLPSEVWIAMVDRPSGRHIRRWDTKPFEGASRFVLVERP